MSTQEQNTPPDTVPQVIAEKDKRIAELEALLRETLYRFEDGQWFPSDLYDKIWNAIKINRNE